MRAEVARLVVRWGALRVGRALAVHLVVRLVAVWMLVVQLDAMVDWRASWALVAEAPVGAFAAAFAVVSVLQGLSERAATRRLWLAPHGVLLRQPIGSAELGVGALALLGVLASPVGAIAAMATGSVLTAVTWTLLVALTTGAWAVGARHGLLASLGGAALAALAQGHAVGALAVVLGATAVGVPALGSASRHAAVEGGPGAGAVPLPRPRGPLAALLQRDALLLWRADRTPVLSSLGVAAGLALVLGLVRRNNTDPAGLVGGGAVFGLAAAGLVAHGAVTTVVRTLGPRFDPPSWPIAPTVRAASIVLLAASLLAPSAAVAAVGGWGVVGWDQQLVQAGVGAALSGAVALTVTGRPGRPTTGTYLLWVVGIAWASVAVDSLGAVTLTVACTAVALAGTTRQLARARARRPL